MSRRRDLPPPRPRPGAHSATTLSSRWCTSTTAGSRAGSRLIGRTARANAQRTTPATTPTDAAEEEACPRRARRHLVAGTEPADGRPAPRSSGTSRAASPPSAGWCAPTGSPCPQAGAPSGTALRRQWRAGGGRSAPHGPGAVPDPGACGRVCALTAAAAPPCSHGDQAAPEGATVSPWLRSTARPALTGVLTGAAAGAALAFSVSVPRAWEPLDVVTPLVLGGTLGVLAVLPTTALCAVTGLLVLARRPSQGRLATFWLCFWPRSVCASAWPCSVWRAGLLGGA